MRTDYKFWYINRDDDGFITHCAVRFFEGEYDAEGKYKRIKRLQKESLKHLVGEFTKEATGDDCKLYTQANFSRIKTDEELCVFLNKELSKDKGREPIDEQKWQN